MSTRNQMVLCNSKNQEVFKTLIPLVLVLSAHKKIYLTYLNFIPIY